MQAKATPRKLGEVTKRNGQPARTSEIRKQMLRDLVRIVRGQSDIGGKRVSDMTQEEMLQALHTSPAIYDPQTGNLRAEIVAEAAALMVEPPPREPEVAGIQVLPGGKWALDKDADALRQMTEQADRDARNHEARAVFSADPLP
jgi:hypothetical protein